MSATTEPNASTRGDRVLAWVERTGNKLPDPFILFLILFLVVGVISTLLAAMDAQVTLPGADEPLVINGLFTAEGLTWLTVNIGANFIGFPPLLTVVTILLAVTVAERTGLLAAAIRLTLASAPRWLLPYALGVVGVTASVMADASMIVIPPLAAAVFKAAGRHPMAGLVGGFAAAGAGYSTSLVVTSLDALFSGITNSVTSTLPDPGAAVTPISNYYFNVASAIVLALVAGFIIDRVLEPRMVRQNVPTDEVEGDADDRFQSNDEEVAAALRSHRQPLEAQLTPQERKAFWVAIATGTVLAVAMVLAVLPQGSPWRNDAGNFLPESALMDSIVFITFVLFLAPGIVYGFVAGTLKTAADVPKVMGEGIKEMAPFLVLAFMLGQFIALFNWSNVGPALAKVGADGLQGTGLTGFPVIVGFIILCSILNLFIISGSSMYTIMGAVFVPMFALIGFEPGFTQAAFRIGDSATQVITPMNPYMFVVLMMIRKYEPAAGLGTLISRTLPFVIPFWVAWLLVLVVFYFAGLDVGPGVSPRMD